MQDMKIGFEIHQQLDTTKLFCDCPSVIRDDTADLETKRRLRPTLSELGEIDQAAMEEFLKGRDFLYQGYQDTNCLVELDEEPPHLPNPEAIEIAIQVAALLNATVIDEIHFMRKLVIDGSNTSGFQRTAIVALDGVLDIDGERIRIPTICLEEEAARKVEEKGKTTIYRLDRLGIPLIEITTAPDIRTPAHAREVALKIGEILRATGKVKRGIGTIRQDINVSIKGGARVEIKGVQELNQIPVIIENEVRRQKMLIEIRDRLKRDRLKGIRNDRKDDFLVFDVTDIFSDTSSRVIKSQLKRGRNRTGAKVLALRLCGLKGLLKDRLGPEFAGYARAAAGVRGIFHIDELPAYGISQDEVDRVKMAMELGDGDAFVLAAGGEETAKKALRAVYERYLTAFDGVPEETRVANTDGTTSYMRPLPGAARMYPETDVPPEVITKERLSAVRAGLPELFDEKIERFIRDYGLGRELANQLVKSEYAGFFERVLGEVAIQPTLVANTLLGTMKDLKRDGIQVDNVPGEKILDVFVQVSKGRAVKEAIPDIIKAISENPESTVEDVIGALGTQFGEEDLRKIVRKVIEDREDFIKEKGEHSAKPLMGLVMKDVRGKADGRTVSEIVNEELKKYLSTIQVR